MAGEPGIGKTRLVLELLDSLADDVVTLVGRAEPSSLARPYEVLLDALEPREDVDSEALAALADPARSPVERLHTALQIVTALVGDRPSVLVFDDLHWADSESTALFERIADQPGPRLLVGTYRPDEVTSRHPVAAVLGRLERRHGLTRVALERFGEADTAAMLAQITGRPAPYRSVAALHQRTGGNPFFLEELVRGYDGDDLDALLESPLPWSVSEVLRRQLDGIEPQSHRIIEAAAVLGHRVPFDLLAAVTGASEADLITALRDLVDRGGLVESGDDEFTFRHALVREAIAGQLLGRQRRRLHEAALDALLAAGSADPAMVAHHAQRAGRYDDMVTAARAGTTLYLSIGSPYQALQLAEMGLDEAVDDPDLLGGAAQAAWLAGLVDDAVGYARRWRDGAVDAVERAHALYLSIRLAYEAEDPAGMESLTSELERLLDELPPADQARAMTAIAQSMMLRDETDTALAWADRSLAIADELGLPRVRLAALVEKGLALTDRWTTNEAGRELLAGLVDEAEELGEWVLAARALNNLVQNVPPSTQAEHAALLERMRVDAERAGFESLAVAAYFQGKARLAIREGDLGPAIGALERARERDRGFERGGRRADYHAVFLAGLYLEDGQLDRVDQILDDIRGLPFASGLTLPGLEFHLACRRGDVATADAQLDEIFLALAEQPWRSGSQAHDLVSAALAVGLPLARLERMAKELLAADVWDSYRSLVEAQLDEARGDLDAALRGYAVVAEATALPPPVRGTAHVGAARCLVARGRRDEAIAQVAAATAWLERWRGWRVAQLERVRDQLGLAPADGRRSVTGPGALTEREREVALLVAEGLTNAELARRLFIAPKTAAVHVSNILHKLEVSSRTEVAAAIGQPATKGSTVMSK